MTTNTPLKSDHQKRVEEFMDKAEQEVPARLVQLTQKTRLLRAKLILEEAIETITKGLGVSIYTTDRDDYTNVESIEDLDLSIKDTYDLIELVDGCCDLKVVTTGTLSTLGLPDEPFQKIVDKKNLEKFGPGGYRREDGKWVKPSDFVGPEAAIRQELKKYE